MLKVAGKVFTNQVSSLFIRRGGAVHATHPGHTTAALAAVLLALRESMNEWNRSCLKQQKINLTAQGRRWLLWDKAVNLLKNIFL